MFAPHTQQVACHHGACMLHALHWVCRSALQKSACKTKALFSCILTHNTIFPTYCHMHANGLSRPQPHHVTSDLLVLGKLGLCPCHSRSCYRLAYAENPAGEWLWHSYMTHRNGNQCHRLASHWELADAQGCFEQRASGRESCCSGCVVAAAGLWLAHASRPCRRRALHILLSQGELPVNLSALPTIVWPTLPLPGSTAHVRTAHGRGRLPTPP